MSRHPPKDAYRPMVAPWAVKVGAAAAPHAALGRAVEPGTWLGRAPPPPPPQQPVPVDASPRARDSADGVALPADADGFEELARAAAAPPRGASVAARCGALRALRAGAAATPALPPPGLSAACVAACFDAVLLPWAAAAEAEADAAAGAPPRDGATSPPELREWLEGAERAFAALTRWPAFAPAELPPRWPAALFARLRSERTREDDVSRLRAMLHWAYRAVPSARRALRRHVGGLLAACAAPGAAWPPPPGLSGALDALACVVAGLRAPLGAHHRALLLEALLPLYKIRGALPDTSPPRAALATVAEPLRRCVCALVTRAPDWGAPAAAAIAAAWPLPSEAAASKGELLLAAVEDVVAAAGARGGAAALAAAMPAIAAALRGEHAGAAERAAAAAAAPGVVAAARASPAAVLGALVPLLVGDARRHWSADVNAARHAALLALRGVDRSLFDAAAADAIRDALAAAPATSAPAAKQPATDVELLLALLAPADDGAAAAAGRAEAASMAAAPSLLAPDVTYQDLVFGAQLGSGTFSTVSAARVIAKGTPPSAWREVAVKRLRADMLAARHYAAAAAREVAALRAVAHPGVARLVAAFRLRRDVYLVLEHAPGGDLHTLLQRLGSLAEAPARFLAGELTAALRAVHAAGLAFGDLKPENVVLTAGGHAKLTDFGAARPLQGNARGVAAAGAAAAAAVLAQLRDGDWRAKAGLPARQGDAASSAGGDDVAEHADDAAEEAAEERLEGTAAYLAPELVAGGAPSIETDAWALGCVAFQCLTGRPPLWADGGQEALLALIADWPGADASLFPAGFPADAAAFVTALLEPSPRVRLGGSAAGLADAARHAWLSGLDCETLHAHAPPPFARGVAAPPLPGAPHAARQNSILWSRRPGGSAPLAGGQGSLLAVVAETDAEAGAPWLGGAPPAAAPARPGSRLRPPLAPPGGAQLAALAEDAE